MAPRWTTLEGKLVDLLGQRKAGDGQLILDRTRLLLAYLGVQKVTNNLLWFVLPLHSCGDDLIVCGLHSVEL